MPGLLFVCSSGNAHHDECYEGDGDVADKDVNAGISGVLGGGTFTFFYFHFLSFRNTQLMKGLQVCLAEELSLSFTFTFRNKQLMTGFQVCLAEEAVASNPSLPASTRQVVFSLPIISTYNFHLLLLSLSVTFTFRNFHFL